MLIQHKALLTTLILSGLFYANNSRAQSQEEAASSTVLEEVVVTGIRGSLQNALNAKRGADQVIDGISAEDLGKFPDENIAESMQRVTGVSITRENGEGSRVSVRGLSPDLTKVTLNGQSISTASGGRDFDFQSIASEIVSAVEVIKSPTPDLDEGGVGATVNIKTPLPLDLGSRKLVASIKAGYDDLSGEASPRGSFLFSDIYGADEQLGFLVAVSYSERSLRQDVFTGGWESRTVADFDPALGLTEDPFTPRNFQPRLELDERSRVNVNSALQVDISDSVRAYLTGTFTQLDSEQSDYRIPYRMFRTRTRGGVFAFEDVTLVGDTVTAATLNDPGIRVRSGIENNKTDTFALGTGVEWTNEVWVASGALNWTQADLTQEDYFVAFENRYSVAYDVNAGASNPESLNITPAVDLDDHSQFGFDRFQGNPQQVDDEEKSLQGDFERFFDGGFLSSVKFGVKYKERDNEILTTRSQIRGLSLDFADYAIPFPVNDYLSGFGAVADSFAVGNVSAMTDAVSQLNGGLDFGFRPLESGSVAEDTVAGYIMASFGSDSGNTPYRGNFGVRYVSTDTESAGYQTDDPDDPNATPVTETADYSDALPSLNLSFDLSDELLLRFAAASVMTRPTLSDIRLSQTINEAQLQAFFTNPQLDPFRADQFDVSLEWYFDQGALVSIALFRKDIESFITEVTTDNVDLGLDVTSPGAPGVPDGINDLFQVTQVVNGLGAEVNGVELSYQQNFTFLPAPFDGFGVLLNYTFADSESNFVDQQTGQALPLPGQSENTYNAILFYEGEKFAARIAYNYRDEFLDTPVGGGGLPEFTNSLGQIDFSASYHLTDKLSVSVEGLNVNNEKLVQYSGIPIRLNRYDETGARYFLGFRYTL